MCVRYGTGTVPVRTTRKMIESFKSVEPNKPLEGCFTSLKKKKKKNEPNDNGFYNKSS